MTKIELLFLLVILGPVCCEPAAKRKPVANQEQNVTQKQMTGEDHYYKANALAEQRDSLVLWQLFGWADAPLGDTSQ